MNYYFLLAVPLAAVATLVVAGCTCNRPFRTGYNSTNPALPGPDVTNAVIEATPDYKLGFVEFDDQGWFWCPKQKNAVEEMIRDECGINPGGTPAGAIMVLFVHGWKNNAAYDNTNVVTFRCVLKELGDLEKTLAQGKNRAPRKLIGVYAGWRGLSVKSDYFPVPLGKEMSFWGRKNAAQRVGGYGAMTELLVDLESLQKTSNASLPPDAPQTKLIIVGHSFGADAVYNAVSQIITERFVDTIKQGQLLKPLGDQIILLNPAFEAVRLYDLKQLALSVRNYSTNQRPVLSVFTSEGDWATHYFFPLGQTVGTMFQSQRSPLQRKASHQAVGWFDPFITHRLLYQPGAAPSSAAKTLALQPPDRLRVTADNIIAQRHAWRTASHASDTNVFGDCVLESTGNYRPHNPILVVSVDKKIMQDHDDIANTNLIQFLKEYIPFCDNDPAGN